MTGKSDFKNILKIENKIAFKGSLKIRLQNTIKMYFENRKYNSISKILLKSFSKNMHFYSNKLM